MSDAVPLPPHPDLKQYKRLAKELLTAARSDQPDAARYLAKQGAEVNLAEAWEHATWYGHLDIVRYLLDAGVDPGSRSKDGVTALERATHAGQVEVVALLLERGAPPPLSP